MNKLFSIALTITCLCITMIRAQEPEKESLEDLQKKVDVLASEIQRLKDDKKEILLPLTEQGKFGLSPAASKVYGVEQGVSIGGYGEMLYENFEKGNSELDFLRVITYVGYKFNKQWVFNSEIEFEHGSTNNAGSVSVEFAYLDYLYRDWLNFRAGLLLVPMGWINELHEPTVFLGAERPETERLIIPSTWRENGLGIFGSVSKLNYKFYILNGFDATGLGASGASGYTSNGFRDARQNGSKAIANDFAAVLRLDTTPVQGLIVGTSVYAGESGQTRKDNNGETIHGWTTIADAHVDYRWRGLEMRGLFAFANVGDAKEINDALGAPASGVAKNLMGYYAQVGYDVLQELETEQKLIPFFRYERVDTQYDVAAGYTEDLSKKRDFYTVGLSYKPIMNVVLKGDYQFQSNDASTGVDQWNLALGYLF